MKETFLPYKIRIRGHLAPERLRHFGELMVCHKASGETVIVGLFRDQPALYGLLNWLQRLGATLLLVEQVGDSPDQEDTLEREVGA
jgi:hypothetical protein